MGQIVTVKKQVGALKIAQKSHRTMIRGLVFIPICRPPRDIRMNLNWQSTLTRRIGRQLQVAWLELYAYPFGFRCLMVTLVCVYYYVLGNWYRGGHANTVRWLEMIGRVTDRSAHRTLARSNGSRQRFNDSSDMQVLLHPMDSSIHWNL